MRNRIQIVCRETNHGVELHANPPNEHCLRTKRDKLGHEIMK